MKTFKEDKDGNDSFPRANNGLTDPAYMEQLEKLENSDITTKCKEYISDAMMTFNINNNIPLNNTNQHFLLKTNTLLIQNTTSEYSEEALSVKKCFTSKQNQKVITPLKNNTKQEQKEKYEKEIKAQEKKNDLEKEARMELSITGCVQISFLFPYIKYEITIYDKEKKAYLKVYRRYCEFENLRRVLVNKYACVYTPPLPGKILFGIFEKDLLEKRKKFLQIFLHELQYLVYYFYDSPEIKAFLDPNVDYFSPDDNLIVSNIPSLDVDESLTQLTSFAEISKKTFVNNIQNIHDKIVLKLREQDMSMTDKLTEIVIKSYPRKIIQKNRNTVMSFANRLKGQQSKFVQDLFIVLENIKNQQKDFHKAESTFNEQLLIFQKDYVNNISMGESKAIISNEIKSKMNKLSIEKPLYVLVKNISDWAYREDNIIQSYCDSFFSLNYFIDKEKEIRQEIRLIKMSKNKMKRKEELNKLLRLNHLLNEILILNTIYLHDVRIDRYKYSRFQLYYNAIKFCIEKNKENTSMHNAIYELIDNKYIVN